MTCNLRIEELIPAIYVNCSRTIHWRKTGQFESFPRIFQIWIGEEKTSLSPLVEAVRRETMNVSLSYGERSEKIRSFSVFKRCRRETWRARGRFKFQVTGVPRPSWSLHSPPSLWHERYPSILPGEFSYTSPDWTSTLVQIERLSLAPKTPVHLIYVSSLLALSSLVNYLFVLFAYFSAGTFPLSD